MSTFADILRSVVLHISQQAQSSFLFHPGTGRPNLEIKSLKLGPHNSLFIYYAPLRPMVVEPKATVGDWSTLIE